MISKSVILQNTMSLNFVSVSVQDRLRYITTRDGRCLFFGKNQTRLRHAISLFVMVGAYTFRKYQTGLR